MYNHLPIYQAPYPKDILRSPDPHVFFASFDFLLESDPNFGSLGASLTMLHAMMTRPQYLALIKKLPLASQDPKAFLECVLCVLYDAEKAEALPLEVTEGFAQFLSKAEGDALARAAERLARYLLIFGPQQLVSGHSALSQRLGLLREALLVWIGTFPAEHPPDDQAVRDQLWAMVPHYFPEHFPHLLPKNERAEDTGSWKDTLVTGVDLRGRLSTIPQPPASFEPLEPPAPLDPFASGGEDLEPSSAAQDDLDKTIVTGGWTIEETLDEGASFGEGPDEDKPSGAALPVLSRAPVAKSEAEEYEAGYGLRRGQPLAEERPADGERAEGRGADSDDLRLDEVIEYDEEETEEASKLVASDDEVVLSGMPEPVPLAAEDIQRRPIPLGAKLKPIPPPSYEEARLGVESKPVPPPVVEKLPSPEEPPLLEPFDYTSVTRAGMPTPTPVPPGAPPPPQTSTAPPLPPQARPAPSKTSAAPTLRGGVAPVPKRFERDEDSALSRTGQFDAFQGAPADDRLTTTKTETAKAPPLPSGGAPPDPFGGLPASSPPLGPSGFAAPMPPPSRSSGFAAPMPPPPPPPISSADAAPPAVSAPAGPPAFRGPVAPAPAPAPAAEPAPAAAPAPVEPARRSGGAAPSSGKGASSLGSQSGEAAPELDDSRTLGGSLDRQRSRAPMKDDAKRGEAPPKDAAKRSDDAPLEDALLTEEGEGTGFEEKAKKKRKAADKYSEEMEKEQAEAPRPVEERREQETTRSQRELRLGEQDLTRSDQGLTRIEQEIERAPAKEAKADLAQLPKKPASSVLEEDAPSMKADLAQFPDEEAASSVLEEAASSVLEEATSSVLEEAGESVAPSTKTVSGAAGGDANLGPSAEVSEPSPMPSSSPMPPAPSMPPAEIPPIALGKAPYPQQAPIEAPARSKSAFSVLGRIVSTILMFPLIVLAAPFAALYWVGKQIKRGVGWMFSRSRASLEKKAQEKGVKLYELFLSEEATKPGPIERTIAQSKVLLRVVSAFFGLWTVALLCFVDAVLSVFTQYAHKLLGYWKTLKSKGKTFLRKRNRTLHQGMAEDLMKLRLQLSQLLLMPGFSPQECAASISKEELKALVLSPTFPLHQVLEARCRLDEVKTDIGGLSSFHLQTFLKKAMKGGILQVGEKILDLLKHIVPNPFLFVRGWKDLYLMWRYMRYSRRELLEMYARLVDDFQTLLAMSLESANAKDAEKDIPPETIEPVLMALFPYEEALFERLGLQRNSLLQKGEMNQRLAVEATQRDMQRLLQVMCLAGRFLLPQRWSRAELLLEYQAMSVNNRFSPQVALEVEAWLDQEVKQIIDSTKILAPHEEFEAQLQEEALRKSRQRALRKIVKQRGFWV